MKTLIALTLLGVATLGYAGEGHDGCCEKPAATLPSAHEQHGEPQACNRCLQHGADPKQDKTAGGQEQIMG